jgi:SH3 domain-containing YSC84-like protein 1
MKNKFVCIGAAVALLIGSAFAAETEDRQKELERIKAATNVLEEIQNAPDKGIPEEILASADCVAVIPSMLKGGFVFGANYGKGVATCRHGNKWSAPAPIRIEGGSWGLQIGGQAVDLVMLIMNQKGMNQLLSSKFKVGADASAAAGPVGRHAEGSTDWKMRAEVLTYSRARGAFAGITLNGAVIKQDEDDTVALYGKSIPFARILSGAIPPPPAAQPFLATVAKYFHEAKTGEAASNRTSGAGSTTATRSHETASPAASGGTAGTTTEATSTSKTTTAETSSSNVGSNTDTSASAGQTGNTTETSTADVKSNIEKALRDTPGVSSGNVNVNVTSDTIELTGSVPSENDKANIRRVAEQNAGGKKVVDKDLVVK